MRRRGMIKKNPDFHKCRPELASGTVLPSLVSPCTDRILVLVALGFISGSGFEARLLLISRTVFGAAAIAVAPDLVKG